MFFMLPFQKARKDRLPGGLADKKKPRDFDSEALANGIKVELEHTQDRQLAREIAMDHLTEDPRYYEKLATIEKAVTIGPRGGRIVGYRSNGKAIYERRGGRQTKPKSDADEPKPEHEEDTSPEGQLDRTRNALKRIADRDPKKARERAKQLKERARSGAGGQNKGFLAALEALLESYIHPSRHVPGGGLDGRGDEEEDSKEQSRKKTPAEEEQEAKKSLRLPISLEKAGPFVGPRGGKWADPEHTKPWKEGVPHERLQEDAHAAVKQEVIAAAHRAIGAGAAPSDMQYIGAGMEGIIFQSGGKAYKAGRYAAQRMARELFPESEPSAVPEEPTPPPPPSGQQLDPDWVNRKLRYYHENVSPTMWTAEQVGSYTGLSNQEAQEMVDTLVRRGDLEPAPNEPGWYRVITEKSMLYTISLRKAAGLPERPHVLAKAAAVAGPFIGPRGGKWADPQHKIPWKERTGRAPAKEEEPKAEAERNWVDHRPGLPKQTVHKYATVIGHDKDGDPINVYLGSRKALHDRIVKSFIAGKQPPKGKKIAVVMMGGAASGKTSLVKQVMGDQFGTFVNVNPDDVKEKMPEYNAALEFKVGGRTVSARDAAWMAHEESSDIAQEVYNQALDAGFNMIVDGTGKNGKKHQAKIQALKDEGYEIHMLMPHIDMDSAIERVETRAVKTGRFVPTEVVRDQYSKIPSNFEASARMADRFQLFDSRGRPPVVKWEGPPDKIHDQAFVEHFKSKGAAPMVKSDAGGGGIQWDKLDGDNFVPKKGKRLRYS